MSALVALALACAVVALAASVAAAFYLRGLREGGARVVRADEGDAVVFLVDADVPPDEAREVMESFRRALASGQQSLFMVAGARGAVVVSARARRAVDVRLQDATDVDSSTGSGRQSATATAASRVEPPTTGEEGNGSGGVGSAREQFRDTRKRIADEDRVEDAIHAAAVASHARITRCTCEERPYEGVVRDPNCPIHSSLPISAAHDHVDPDDASHVKE